MNAPISQTLRTSLASILLPLLLLALSVKSQAQSYVYVNNQSLANSISGYSVSSTGALTPVPGSPYLSGGVGSTTTCQGLDRIISNAAKNLLFVSNSSDQTISAFQINPASGSLTSVVGSPFASGLTLDHCGGISLAATPDGNFLIASSNGQIKTFAVDAAGVLTPGAVTTNCCSPTVGMKISSNGRLLALANETSVSVYSINADGSLTAAAGSPFARAGTGLLTAVDFSCAADRLYGSEASFSSSTITDSWTIGAGGVLTAVAGSPFLGSGTDSTSVALTPDNSWLFTNDQFSNRINSFAVNADGSLSKVGSFGGINAVHVPGGLATDAAGTLLFAADDNFGIAVFTIAGTGSLTSASDVAINPAGEIQGLAAYPARSCTTGDLGLSVTADSATVEAGSNITYTITITNNGSTAAAASIIDNLPAGETFVSCKATGGGVCNLKLPNPHVISFSSIVAGTFQTVTLVAQTDANLSNGATLTNTVRLGTKSIIDTNSANDSATVDITVTAQPGPTTLTVSPASAPYGGLAILTATLQKKSNGALVSGKTISFSINGAAVGTAVTNTVGQAILTANISGLALGSYPGAITAGFAGDATFNASSGAGNLIVNKAVLSVVASGGSRLYADPNPAITYGITGFTNTDTVAVVTGTATCSTTATVSSPVGSYSVTCDISGLSAANYTFVLVPGTLMINPAPLTVTADNKTRVYGDTNPTFTGTVTGLKNGDLLSPTFSTPAFPGAAVGTYPIIPLVSGPVANNYAVTYVNGTLNVTPAPLSVTANNATRFYGDPNPVFTGTVLGIKNNDPITVSYSSPATPLSAPGAYPIIVALGDPEGLLGNYTVTITNGTLTVSPAPLTVAANSFSRVYGAANPVLTGTVVGIKNGDNITATYSTTATVTSPVGPYAIVPTLVDPAGKLSNYAVTKVNGVLTVTPATLTVTIQNASRVYGNANPGFSGTISGLKNADKITATFTTAATLTSPVGTYAITPVFSDPGAKLGNYTVVITGGVLTVTQAPLTITAVGGTRLYGAANPTPTVSGLRNGDNITATYVTPTASSPVGTYTLNPVPVDPGNKLGNYSVTIKTATLTINKVTLTLASNSKTVVLNTASPGFTGTYTGFVLGENASTAAGTGTLTCSASVTSVGSHAITCSGQTFTNYTVTQAGTQGVATVQYAAAGACTAGPGHQILAPIATDGSTIFTRATTTTIPVQFRVCDANGASVSTAGVVSSFTLLRRITGGTTTTLNQRQNAAFSFQAGAQDWLANLSTSTPTNLASGSTYVYQINLNDGTTIGFQFSMN